MRPTSQPLGTKHNITFSISVVIRIVNGAVFCSISEPTNPITVNIIISILMFTEKI